MYCAVHVCSLCSKGFFRSGYKQLYTEMLDFVSAIDVGLLGSCMVGKIWDFFLKKPDFWKMEGKTIVP